MIGKDENPGKDKCGLEGRTWEVLTGPLAWHWGAGAADACRAGACDP